MTKPRILDNGIMNRANFAFDGSILVEKYDLMFHDTDDVKPASSQADGGSEALNQRSFAARFAGVSLDGRLAAETDALAAFPVATDVIGEFDCVSATWEFGDLVTVDEDSGGTFLEDQKLVKTTDPTLAIGYCTTRQASAVTRNEFRLLSNVAKHSSPQVSAGGIIAAAQEDSTTAGALSVNTYYTSVDTTTGTGHASTLAGGLFVGQRKRVQLIVDAGDLVLTVATLSGGNTITFADAGDFAELVWTGSAWVPVQLGNDADGATAPVVSTV